MKKHSNSVQTLTAARRGRLASGMAALVLVAIASTTAHALPINVNTTVDDITDNANCTLREAIQAANTNAVVDGCAAGAAGTDTINIPAGTYTITIAGSGEDLNQTGDFDILEAVDFVGAGAATTIINGGALDRVLHVVNAVVVNVSGVTIQGGSTSGSDGGGIRNNGMLTVTDSTISGNASNTGAGGGIFSDSGTVTVANSTISGNSANGSFAGGIFSTTGTVTIANSTISGNSSTAAGGGIFNNPASTLTVTNSTISGNSAGGGWCGGGIYSSGTLTATNSTITNNAPSAGQPGGGICNSSGTVNLANTIVANQSAGTDCSGGVTSTLNDLDSDGSCGAATTADPLLGPLADNGGSTFTHALQAPSPAIDTGDAATCANPPVSGIDQRGVSRPQGPACDIGAFELNAAPIPTSAVPIPTLSGWAMILLSLLLPAGALLWMRRQKADCEIPDDIHPT